MKPTVVMIGAGQIGQALGRAASKNARVFYWDAVPGKVARQRPLQEILPKADAVIFCVPSWHLRKALLQCVPHLSPRVVTILVSKGLETSTGRSADAVARAALSSRRSIGFIGGPLLAGELLKGKTGIGVAASDRRPALKRILALFEGTNVVLEASADLSGVVWSGILKNIYAFGLGITDGLGWGSNTKGWYVARASAEASRLVGKFGGRSETFFATAGLGDFIATGFSPHSRNRRAGEELIRNGACRTESEGHRTLPYLKKKLGRDIHHYPLLLAVTKTLTRPKHARKMFENLIQ